MKRHPALIPLSHDHHHALVEARRLRQAADTPESTAAATAFLRFFADESVPHFREEQELLFPLLVALEEARELLVQALLEHQRLHALTARLREIVNTGGETAGVMRELGELLEAHVRLEERQLFPLIEPLLEESAPLATRARRPAADQSPLAADRRS
jgi:hemerythrin-like domain-containing protein